MRRAMLPACFNTFFTRTQDATTRGEAPSMRTWKDIFLAMVILCAGGYVGAALLGVLP